MKTQQLYWAMPVWMQEWALSQYARRLDHLYYGGEFAAWCGTFNRLELAGTADIEAYQLEAFQRVARVALRDVPWFREFVARAGIGEDYFRSLAQIRRLPIMEKDPIRTHPLRFVRDDVPHRRLIVHKTSGTTGKALHIYWTRDALRWWWALHEMRVRLWAGVSQAMPRAMVGGRPIVPGDTSAPPFWRYNRRWKQLYLSSYHIAPATAPAYIEAIRRYGCQWITGYGSAIALLGEYLLEHPTDLDVRAVLTSGDTVTSRQRAAIEGGFRCRMFDYYGSAEGCCVISECERGRMHVQPEAGILEILDDKNEPCPPGVDGEFICTGLGNDAMPLLRYRTGDYGCWAAEQRCPCGRHSPIVERITGRTDDYLLLSDGRKVGRLSTAMKQAPSVKQAQLVQDALDHAWLLVVPEPTYRDRDGAALLEDILSRIGAHALRLEVCPVRDIPPTPVGKHVLVRRIIDDDSAQAQYRAVIAQSADHEVP